MSRKHEHGGGCVGVEIPEIYDGVCYYICTDGNRRNRFADEVDANGRQVWSNKRIAKVDKVLKELADHLKSRKEHDDETP